MLVMHTLPVNTNGLGADRFFRCSSEAHRMAFAMRKDN